MEAEDDKPMLITLEFAAEDTADASADETSLDKTAGDEDGRIVEEAFDSLPEDPEPQADNNKLVTMIIAGAILRLFKKFILNPRYSDQTKYYCQPPKLHQFLSNYHFH